MHIVPPKILLLLSSHRVAAAVDRDRSNLTLNRRPILNLHTSATVLRSVSRLRILFLYGVFTMVHAGQLMSMFSCPNKTQTMADSHCMLWLIFPSTGGQPGILNTQRTCQSLLLKQCVTKAAASEHTVLYSYVMHEQFTNFRAWEQVQMNLENQSTFSNR